MYRPHPSLMPVILVLALFSITCGGTEEAPAPADESAPAAEPQAAARSESAPALDPESTPERWFEPAPAPRPLMDPSSEAMNVEAPGTFRAVFDTTKGEFTVDVHRDWAPRGADRFYNLVREGYYDGNRFFRVMDGFVAQFGLNGDPQLNSIWRNADILDDPSNQGNTRGRLTFAHGGPNTRSTQLFINLGDNINLDLDFPAFGEVIDGLGVVGSLYSGYGEGAPRGRGPDQGRIQREGNRYLEREFPQLDYIRTARIIAER